MVCFSSVYRYAKENSGPLKPGVRTVEDTVRTQNCHRTGLRQIDESLRELERQVPSQVKWVSGQARAVACEVQRAGVVDAAKNITKTMYTTYEPTARGLAQIAVPTAAFWSEKYNQVVGSAAERNCTVALYLPLIPVAQTAMVFDGSAGKSVVSANGVVAH
uniref:REF/SRPP-like protein n=2 Tax=Populus TaxID=3689 RepID=A0A4V6ABA7_POPAL|nr:hypothetical protein D5086_0000042300 [Populus alba]